MSATLAKQFQDYAARCLELARAARTTAGRARFMQMAREYQSAASLIHKELSADLRSGGVARLGRGAEQHSPALLKQAGIALPLWPIARLAEVQEPERAGRQAGGGGGLG
jgi:hypothetical protein